MNTVKRTAGAKRFILISRKTRLQALIERFNTWPQAKFYLEHNSVDVSDYLLEHDHYQRQISRAELIMREQGHFQQLERDFLPHYQFRHDDIIVVVGQDGLVANTLKYLTGQPVIAINPDPDRWDGRLLPFHTAQLKAILLRTLSSEVNQQKICLAQASTNDGQRLLAVNDLFIGPQTHTSAHYQLNWQEKSERQSSSGIIVSTGFGSTGWFRSILVGAHAVMGKTCPDETGFAWHEHRLQFAVREPFPSKTSGTQLTFGSITRQAPLTLVSHIPDNGVIFSDGVESDYLAFNTGSTVTITTAEIQGTLVTH